MAESSVIYHIVTEAQLEALKSRTEYRPPSLATEGFMHASASLEQLVWVANRFYRNVTEIRVLCIEASRVKAPLRWEEVGERWTFPHICGGLNLDAVTEVKAMQRDTEGMVTGWA